jgi:FkbM family methyltransferase
MRAKVKIECGQHEDLINKNFIILYGRPPSEEELARLLALEIINTPQPNDVMRRIIAATDRGSLSTPFLIRLGRDDVVWKTDEGFELALDAADIAVSRYVRDGAYEPHLTSFFKRTIRQGMSVVDVGANIGYYSMISSKLVGPSGRVLSFEPNSENARLILMSRERNKFDNLQLYPVALSDHTGHAFFSAALGSNGGILSETLDVLMSPQCSVVPTVRMDDIISERVHFIKMDVEGAEGLVLAGARQLTDSCRPIITMEFSFEMLSRVSGLNPFEVLRHFDSLGYSLNKLDRDGGTDALFPIADIDAFAREYSHTVRIEDLVFLPGVN